MSDLLEWPRFAPNIGGIAKNVRGIEEYFSIHQLNLNASKTQFITFSRKNDTRSTASEIIAIGRTNVEKKNRCKYLGVTIDNYPSFDLQVKQVLQKMAMGIKTIDAIKNQLPTTTLTILHQPIVLSHLSYPALLLPSVSVASFNSLEKQLNWALKCFFFRSQLTSSDNIRKSKHVISIRKLINMICLTYFFQLIKHERPTFQFTNIKISCQL